MAFEQSYQQNTVHFESDEGFSMNQKWKATTIPPPPAQTENVNGCFDCNICLDSANDPVVTLCGHLYCWPCIYKWLDIQSSEQPPKCPVCKSNISSSSLVPLYGRGKSSSESNSKSTRLDLVIPRRPQFHQNQHLLHPNHFRSQQSPPQFHHHHHHRQLVFPHPYGDVGGGSMTSPAGMMLRPTVGIFGEMVIARMFGNNSETSSLFAYPSYQVMGGSGGSSPRIRRQEMHADKSLNRVSIFLLCCFILCLLLF